MKRLLSILIACLVFVSMSACRMCGNGEPICGDKPKDTGTPSSTGSAVPNVYYQYQANYTCAPADGSAPLASWVASLTVDNGGTTVTIGGDRCHPNDKQTVSIGEIDFSITRLLAGYGEVIFIHSAYSGARVETWCEPLDTNQNPKFELLVDTSAAAMFNSTNTALNATQAVVKTDVAGTRSYTAPNTQLTIDTTGASPHAARLDQSPAGFYVGDMKCRLGN